MTPRRLEVTSVIPCSPDPNIQFARGGVCACFVAQVDAWRVRAYVCVRTGIDSGSPRVCPYRFRRHLAEHRLIFRHGCGHSEHSQEFAERKTVLVADRNRLGNVANVASHVDVRGSVPAA